MPEYFEMIIVITGLPGSGKMLQLARISLELLKRNRKYFNKSGIRRLLYSNIKFSEEIEHEFDGFIHYWTELDDIWNSRDCDVIWQEAAVYLDALEYEKVPRELKRWLQLHRHYGVDVYMDTQNFLNIYNGVRRLTNKAFTLFKIFGSRDKSATRPPVKYPWGLILQLQIDPATFGEETFKMRYKGWKLRWISKKLCKVFDSYVDLDYNSYPPLKHIHRQCKICGAEHTKHA